MRFDVAGKSRREKVPVNIFIADDHAVLRDGLRLLLETQPDIRVIGEACDGNELLQVFKKNAPLSPDIVIMDIGMPGLDGIEATRQLKHMYPSIKVIILSAHDSSEYISQALRVRANGFLSKESSSTEVILALREVHAGKRYLGQGIAEKIVEAHISEHETCADGNPVNRLNIREREILGLVVNGNTSAEIANKISISQKTVETYRSRMMKKLGVKGITGLVKFAVENGLISILVLLLPFAPIKLT